MAGEYKSIFSSNNWFKKGRPSFTPITTDALFPSQNQKVNLEPRAEERKQGNIDPMTIEAFKFLGIDKEWYPGIAETSPIGKKSLMKWL